ncbi:MAG: right-handed parallel beta-helix repeat-containing protein [Methanobacterium sp.]|uniref:hypothetical protein n=1 Tax=Methanobacterium sp. TaxID=2164 RepID=UPI003D64CD3E|nr:right-handed parallel beta-helix repeat-containing protein [Methanobacterium sp.]
MENYKGGEKIKKQAIIILITLSFALMFAGAVSAEDSSSTTILDDQNSNSYPADTTSTENTAQSTALPDPRVVRGGTVVYTSTTIQDAVNHAIDGDTIEVDPGTYNENILVNKRLTIFPTGAGTATVTSFMITTPGSDSIIQGFTINNPTGIGVDINSADNCQILRNTISGSLIAVQISGNNNYIHDNTLNGVTDPSGNSETVILGNAADNVISKNIITAAGSSDAYGIWLNTAADHNTVAENTITVIGTPTSGAYGILIGDSHNLIVGNILSVISTSTAAYGMYIDTVNGNYISENSITARTGIYSLSPDNRINFNRIISTNEAISLLSSGTLDAQYNWYGSNADPSSKIFNGRGHTVNYSPWLIMTVTASPTTIHTGGTSTITADFTHDSAGGVHPATEHFPDKIPVTFTTNLGTINNPGETLNGKATATLTAGSTPGVATASAALDSQAPIPTSVNIANQVNAGTYTYTVKVRYKKGWYKSWRKKWFKSHGKWKYKWRYKWKYGWLYHTVTRTSTR